MICSLVLFVCLAFSSVLVLVQPLMAYNFFFPAVDCGSLDSPMNGSFFGNLTVFPNSVRFDCDAGFILSGSSVRTCQSNGIWSGYETKCSGEITSLKGLIKVTAPASNRYHI